MEKKGKRGREGRYSVTLLQTTSPKIGIPTDQENDIKPSVIEAEVQLPQYSCDDSTAEQETLVTVYLLRV